MDIRQTLKDTENSIRDFVSIIMENNLGKDWFSTSSGISEERFNLLQERKDWYEERHSDLAEENRLINYTNFHDIYTIIAHNWEGDFEIAFGDLKTLETYLTVIERHNNPDTHNRALLIHQKHLILGISGELRNKMIVYRSWKENGTKGFPKIESVQDNLGNLWIYGKPKKIKTALNLRVGDVVEFVVTAKDPEDMDLEYRIYPEKWQSSNVLLLQIQEKHIGAQGNVHIAIKSPRKHKAYPLGYDDRVTFEYTILPNE